MLFDTKIAYAQSFTTFASKSPAAASMLTKIFQAIVIPISQAFFAFSLLVFLWGVFQMIAHAGDSDARSTGQQHVLWGVIGIFIMVTVYGIIRFIASSVGASDPFQ